MKEIDRKLAWLAAALILCFPSAAQAAEPLKSYMEIKDGRHLFIQTYEVAPDEDPSRLKAEPFVLDGFSYSFLDMEQDEIISEERRTETQIQMRESQSNDIAAILEQLPLTIDYNEGGFVGELRLDSDSIATEVKGYVAKTYNVTDSMLLRGVSSNDNSLVPKTTTKNGVTLQLTGVDWSVGASESVDYESVPLSYNGVASYSGSYTKKIPTGYVTTATYRGEVVNKTVDSIVYTLTYIGEKQPYTLFASEDSAGIPAVALIGGIGLAALLGAAAYFLLYPNTVIYLKEGEGSRRIGRMHVKCESPLVDLSRYDVAGQEVAVRTKQRTANRLFGRQIRTVAEGGYSFKCLVDRQDGDFWYSVTVPESAEETIEDSEGGEEREN